MSRGGKFAKLAANRSTEACDEADQPLSVNDDEADVHDIQDYFVEKDGLRFAGIHLLIDLIDATNLSDAKLIERTMTDAARAAGATVLHSHLHHYSENGGVSGVVVLAESHISIHTWPERSFAAVDIFTCGQCDPYAAVEVLRRAFVPGSVQVTEQKRGLLF